MRAYRTQAREDKLAAHGVRLIRAVLEQQPAAGVQVRGRAAREHPQALERIRAGRERELRLVSQRGIGEGRIIRGHVRRGADDEVEALPLQGLVPAAGAQLEALEPERGRVRARDGERRLGHLGREHPPAGSLARERERDRAAARAKVGHGAVRSRAQAQRPLHQELGLRTRDQYRGRDCESERPELAPPGEISDRLPGGTPLDEAQVALGGLQGRHLLRVGLEARAGDPEDLDEQHPGIEPRRVRPLSASARRPQAPRAVLEQRGDGHNRIHRRNSAAPRQHPRVQPPLSPPQRPLSIGEIVDAAFRIFLATVVKCLPYALVAVVAEQLPNIYYIVTGRGVLLAMFTAVKDPRWLLFDGIGLAIAMFLCSAMLLRQRALVTGGAAALAPELTAVLRRAPALMLLVVLWVAVVLACLLP